MENPWYSCVTASALRVLNLARWEAQRLNHDFIGTEHLLVGLVQEDSNAAARVLHGMNVDTHTLRARAAMRARSVPATAVREAIPFTLGTKRVIDFAIEEARALGHAHIGTEHVLLGLIKEGRGLGAQALLALGLTLEDVRRCVVQLLASDVSYDEPPPSL